VDGEPNRFFQKLPSLARMGVRAGVQKRNYFRRADKDLARGFLLERASFLLHPLGLDEVVRRLVGPAHSKQAETTTLAKQVIDVVREVCRQESETTGLPLAVAPEHSANLEETPCPLESSQLQRIAEHAAILPSTPVTLRGSGANLVTAIGQLWKKTELQSAFVIMEQ
jgi:hypothetical protein